MVDEVDGVLPSGVLYAKVVDDEAKYEGAGLMLDETGGYACGDISAVLLSWRSLSASGGVNSCARRRSCFLVSVSAGGSSVEWFLDNSAAVRSLAAATMVASGVASGILKLCGNHLTV